MKNLLLIGGINHDYADTGNALAEVLSTAGFETTVMDDINAGLDAVSTHDFDLLTLYTLRWRMLDDDKYIPHRDAWAYEISDEHRNAIHSFLSAGGGLLGMHTASICFDTWPAWQQVLGAKWIWGETFHPPPSKFTVTNMNDRHPVTSGMGDFETTDEIYHNLEPTEDAVELFSTTSTEDRSNQALAWAHEYGKGRVVYDSLGHDRSSMLNPGHADFLRRAAKWCAGANP